MPGVNIAPHRGTMHDRCSHCHDPVHSLSSSSCSCSWSSTSSYMDESSSVPPSRAHTPSESKKGRPVTAGSESRLDLAHRASAPSIRHPPTTPPPRPARNPARICKEVPTRDKLVSESVERKVSVIQCGLNPANPDSGRPTLASRIHLSPSRPISTPSPVPASSIPAWCLFHPITLGDHS